jgi:hypothetical protein
MNCEHCIWFEDYEIEGEAVWRGCLHSSDPENCTDFIAAPLPLYPEN